LIIITLSLWLSECQNDFLLMSITTNSY